MVKTENAGPSVILYPSPEICTGSGVVKNADGIFGAEISCSTAKAAGSGAWGGGAGGSGGGGGEETRNPHWMQKPAPSFNEAPQFAQFISPSY